MPETVHVLYENPARLPPVCSVLEAEGLRFELHEVWRGLVEASAVPAPGIWGNRMSPSSHARAP